MEAYPKQIKKGVRLSDLEEEYRKSQKELVKNWRSGVYKTEKEYRKAERDVWQQYLADKYTQTPTIEDRDKLIDCCFNHYEIDYVELRDKYITHQITEEELKKEFHDFLINAIKIGYDLGICRMITEQEINTFITTIQNAYHTVDTSGGEITEEINRQLCTIQVPEVKLFKSFYYNTLIKEKDKKSQKV